MLMLRYASGLAELTSIPRKGSDPSADLKDYNPIVRG